MRIAQSVTELIGGTPMLELNRLRAARGLNVRLLAKCEAANPAGSAKARAALNGIEAAERNGRLQPGDTVIGAADGASGAALAMICAARGYRAVIVMPGNVRAEFIARVRAYGAEAVLAPAAQGPRGAIEFAARLQERTPGAMLVEQLDNPADSEAHARTTGPEIWRDTDGQIDFLVAGSGGTITGAGGYLKEKKRALRLVGVGCADTSPRANGSEADFAPGAFKPALIDEFIDIESGQAGQMCRELARCEGLLTGLNAGAAVCAAVKLAERIENCGKTIVAILSDNGESCLSAGLFEE